MSLASALTRAWQDGAAVFTSTGYSSFSIEIHLVCVTILLILFNRQQNSSDQAEHRVIWGKLLFVQILYCLSGILRVLVDIEIIPKTPLLQSLITGANFLIVSYMCRMIFVYMEACQNSSLLDSLPVRVCISLPFIVNVLLMITTPFTGWYLNITSESVTRGLLFPEMAATNLAYPAASIALALFRRRKLGRYERDRFSAYMVYSAIFVVFGTLQAVNWKIPFMCYAIILSDIFVYIYYAESMVSVDPLTKIPNRNGLTRALSERLKKPNPERVHVFAVDIDDLSGLNSSHGRTEGDKALILIAGALQKFRSEEHPCFASRYYGDEFVIMSDIEDDEELDLFVEHIRNYINNAAVAGNLHYFLRVSIGWAKYEQFSRTETIPGLVEEAERMLAENREQRRFQAMWKHKG